MIAGQSRADATTALADPLRNTAAARPRLRSPVRLDPGPAHVRRIGHAVLRVRDFRTSEKWYKDRFGFLTSDEIEAAKDMPLGAFMRCDRGDKPADHHTLFLAQLPGNPGAWGVGRHILGSQVFDYWKDPFGNELEHWTDGDLLTAAEPPQKVPVSELRSVQWGSPHPSTLQQTGKPQHR